MSLDEKKAAELEQIMSDLADTGANPDSLRRVEELLSNDPALQDFYWEIVGVDTALPIAVDVTREEFVDSPDLAGSIQVSPPIPDDSSQRSDSISVPPGTEGFSWPTLPITALSIAMAVATCVVFSLFLFPGNNPFQVQMELMEPADPRAHKLPVVTRVSWEGPLFANGAAGWGESEPEVLGMVPLEQRVGRNVEGYLLCLPPGASMTIVAIADATGENCLSVTEIVSNGTSAIRRMSFTNTGEGPKPKHASPTAVNKRYGMLGRWSEFNRSSASKYYLLTGVHRSAKAAPDDEWRLSRMAIMLEDPTAVYIGWDDTWQSPKLSDKEYRRDNDFDDLSAAIFFTLPSQPTVKNNAPLVVIKQGESSSNIERKPVNTSDGYAFSISPDETVIIKAATWPKKVHRLLVTDVSTGEVIWEAKNLERKDRLRDTINLGAIAIKNTTTLDQELRLVVITTSTGSKESHRTWERSNFDLLYRQPDFETVGFDDASGNGDFRKVRVNLLRYRGSSSAMDI